MSDLDGFQLVTSKNKTKKPTPPPTKGREVQYSSSSSSSYQGRGGRGGGRGGRSHQDVEPEKLKELAIRRITDSIYRYNKLNPAVSEAELANALASMKTLEDTISYKVNNENRTLPFEAKIDEYDIKNIIRDLEEKNTLNGIFVLKKQLKSNLIEFDFTHIEYFLDDVEDFIDNGEESSIFKSVSKYGLSTQKVAACIIERIITSYTDQIIRGRTEVINGELTGEILDVPESFDWAFRNIFRAHNPKPDQFMDPIYDPMDSLSWNKYYTEAEYRKIVEFLFNKGFKFSSGNKDQETRLTSLASAYAGGAISKQQLEHRCMAIVDNLTFPLVAQSVVAWINTLKEGEPNDHMIYFYYTLYPSECMEKVIDVILTLRDKHEGPHMVIRSLHRDLEQLQQKATTCYVPEMNDKIYPFLTNQAVRDRTNKKFIEKSKIQTAIEYQYVFNYIFMQKIKKTDPKSIFLSTLSSKIEVLKTKSLSKPIDADNNYIMPEIINYIKICTQMLPCTKDIVENIFTSTDLFKSGGNWVIEEDNIPHVILKGCTNYPRSFTALNGVIAQYATNLKNATVSVRNKVVADQITSFFNL